jgi:hypothetical protein
MNSSTLTQAKATQFISTWLNRNHYSGLFENDLSLLLSENRRARKSNVLKYGVIPFDKDIKGRVRYALKDIQNLCNDRLKPICKALEQERLKKAAKAAAGAKLPYAA